MKTIRKIRIVGDVAYVALTKGYEAIISSADAHLVERHNWVVVIKKCNKIYAYRSIGPRGKQRTIYMHRVIMNAPDGYEVDHVNGDGLDNRRQNMRLVTHQQNLCNQLISSKNRSGFRGVSWDKNMKTWRAQITVHYKMKFLGLFESAESAHAAYVEASKMLHGQYGSFPYRAARERAEIQQRLQG